MYKLLIQKVPSRSDHFCEKNIKLSFQKLSFGSLEIVMVFKKAISMYVSVSFKCFPSMKIHKSRKSTFPEIQRKAIESRDV